MLSLLERYENQKNIKEEKELRCWLFDGFYSPRLSIQYSRQRGSFCFLRRIMSIKDKYYVDRISFNDCKDWILKKHYAHRIPSISYAFGLFDKNKTLQGVCTFGTPSSSTLKYGVCGEQYVNIVIELNRLIINQKDKNMTSFLVSQTLKKIDKPKIIISYADTSQNHTGYIYQATNFIYTGLSAKRTDWKIKGLENLHGQTIADISRGQKHRAEYMREKFGDSFYLEDRSRKHRYIYFIGTKKQKKEMLKSLKYKIQPYPKGDNVNYDASYQPEIQGKLF
jgi:hypothetical protein